MADEIHPPLASSERGYAHRIATSKVMGLAPMALMVGLGIAGTFAGFVAAESDALPWSYNTWATIGLFAGIIVGAVLGLKVMRWTKRAHVLDTEAVTTWARGQGLEPSTHQPMTYESRIEPFSHAGRHIVGSMWAGRYRGQRVEIYHYLVDAGTRKHPEKRAYTVVAANLNAVIDVVEALPQRGAQAVAVRLGARDVTVESDSFNRAWRVRAADQELAHELLTAPVVARLVDAAGLRVPVAWDRSAVMCVTPGVIKDTEVLAERLSLVADVAEMVPGHLRRDGAPDDVDDDAADDEAPDDDADDATGEAEDADVRDRRRVRKTRSSLELLVLAVAIATLYGSAWAWGRFGPAAGVPLLSAGFLLTVRSAHVTAFIKRLLRRH